MKKLILALLILVTIVMATSCRPYDRPEFVDIDSNETAFIIPLVQDTKSQAKYMSEEYLRENMIATKRVQIPHMWVQTGRAPFSGNWVATVRVIKVNRTPVSVTWNGNDSKTAVMLESKESIGFTLPISLTAMISEEDTPKFLNKYTSSKSLLDVVNTDVNAFIKTKSSEAFGLMTLEECKVQKAEVLKRVFEEAKVFFKDYGVTLTQFGMIDGFLYDKKEIQSAIDDQIVQQSLGRVMKEKSINAEITRELDRKNAEVAREIALENAKNVAAIETLAANTKTDIARYDAEQKLETLEVVTKIKQLEIEQTRANAFLVWAQSGGQLPNVIPEGVFTSMGLTEFFK